MMRGSGKKIGRSAALLMSLLTVLSVCSCVEKTPEKPPLEVDAKYEPYLIPWYLDASGAAVKNKTLDFYFMSDSNAYSDHAEELGITETWWGDATVIFFPNGEVMLLDSGATQYAPFVVQNLKYLGVDTIDYLVFSHPHSDHAYGAFAEGGVFDSFTVKNVWHSGALNVSWADVNGTENKAARYGATCTQWCAGQQTQVGDVTIDFFNPTEDKQGQTFRGDPNVNHTSLVMRFSYGENAALFTGDLYIVDEMRIVKEYGDALHADLLKVPHHGRPTSSTAQLAEAVSPAVAVALGDVEMNELVYRTYAEAGADVYYDRRDGYVHVTMDGKELTTETSHERNTTIYDRYDRPAA